MLLGLACAPGDPAATSDANDSSGAPATTNEPPGGDTNPQPPGGTTQADSATSVIGTTQGGADTDTGGDDDPTASPPIFDLGTTPDAPKFDMGCRKVDFLFAIDNSGSMSAQQTQLLASFDGFITAIQDALDETVDSYHVGVITSDAYSSNAPGCTSLGNLVTRSQGGGNCEPFAEGNRFATEADDLLEKFPCMASVGATGSPIEQPVTGSIAALDPAVAGPGQCNEGFLRDDAILVLVIVTDDPPYDFDMDDAHLATDTTDWHQSIIDAKNGDPEALVVIGFVPWGDLSCIFGGESPNLISFIESFGEQGVMASICEPDFSPVFAQTVETIVTTCENFDPQG